MEDQMLPPLPLAHKKNARTTVVIVEDCFDEFRKYACQVVAQEIPEAEGFLQERLAMSIARRRNRFLRWRQHDNPSKRCGKRQRSPEIPKKLALAEPTMVRQLGDSNTERERCSGDVDTAINGPTATTLEAQHFCKSLDSDTGSTKGTESMRWKNIGQFPKPPESDITQSHFVCPVCFILTPAEEAKGDLWIQHVIRDLKPYICLLESCTSPLALFDTFEEWIEHMKEEQMSSEFQCVSASGAPVKSKSQALFESYMGDKHSKSCVEAQLPAPADRSTMSSTSDVFMACPLCSYGFDADDMESPSAMRDQELLQEHVANHLQSLALVSLPLLYSDSATRSESKDSSRGPVDNRPAPPEPRARFRVDVPPYPKLNEREITIDFGQIIRLLPENTNYRSVQRPTPEEYSKDRTWEHAWRPQEKQTPNTEAFDVLLAEDNLINQRIITKILGRHNHAVTVANNGQEALDMIKQRKYDVILMDLLMPIMGGLEAAEKIREHERFVGTGRTPIIAMVVNGSTEDTRKIFGAQMDDYVCKPIPFKKLAEMILKYGALGRSYGRNDVHRSSAKTAALGCAGTKFRAKL